MEPLTEGATVSLAREDGGVRTRATIQYFDGCPGWQRARRNLEAAALEVGIALDVTEQRVQTPEDAERFHFAGSPTILLDGTDPFARPGATPALACRLYATPDGPAAAPTVAQLVAALRGHSGGSTA